MGKYQVNITGSSAGRFVAFLQKLIFFSVKVLALLITMVIFWSVADVFMTLYNKAISPPFLHINVEELFPTLGAFLFVLIAIEIFLNIVLYLDKETHHLRLVLATALMAIARKIIILDYEHSAPFQLLGIGAIIVALGIAYWLVHLSDKPASISYTESKP